MTSRNTNCGWEGRRAAHLQVLGEICKEDGEEISTDHNH